MKLLIPAAVGALSAATLPLTPLAYGEGGDGISTGEFQRYRSQQQLELEQEQDLRARQNPPQSAEEAKLQNRQFEAERARQDILLDQQRRRISVERADTDPAPRPGSSRGITLQQLQREQASQRLDRKLSR